jgi:maleate isomerase
MGLTPPFVKWRLKMANKSFVHGWRGRIGLITPAPGNSTEYEFNHYLPQGVCVLSTRIPLFAISYESLKTMTGYVDGAAKMLAESSLSDIILFNCTAGSFLEKGNYDTQLIEHIESITNLPATTTTTCILEAMEAFGAKSMHIVTPYSPEVNDKERGFFESHEKTVLSVTGALLEHSQDVPKIPAGDMYRYALEADTDDADLMLISCTGLHVLEIIDALEKDLKKPVLTSNQCALWGTLKKLGINEKIEGIGSLFNL